MDSDTSKDPLGASHSTINPFPSSNTTRPVNGLSDSSGGTVAFFTIFTIVLFFWSLTVTLCEESDTFAICADNIIAETFVGDVYTVVDPDVIGVSISRKVLSGINGAVIYKLF
jgi:hypothetical protein